MEGLQIIVYVVLWEGELSVSENRKGYPEELFNVYSLGRWFSKSVIKSSFALCVDYSQSYYSVSRSIGLIVIVHLTAFTGSGTVGVHMRASTRGLKKTPAHPLKSIL